MAIESQEETEMSISLQDENAKLRKQLAAARLELRLLQNEKRETREPAVPPPKQQKRNYREWISRERRDQQHELIPQEEEEEEEVDLRAPDTPTDTAISRRRFASSTHG